MKMTMLKNHVKLKTFLCCLVNKEYERDLKEILIYIQKERALTSGLFWYITQGLMVILYRPFETNHRFHIQE